MHRADSSTPLAAADAGVQHAIALPRVIIEWQAPLVDGGRWPAKAAVAQPLPIEAIIFADGHEQLAARVLLYCVETKQWQKQLLAGPDNDRWRATVYPEHTGKHRLIVEAWIDEWENFRDKLRKRLAAGADVGLEIAEGVRFLRDLCVELECRDNRKRYIGLLRELCDSLDDDSSANTEPAALSMRLLDDDTATLVKALRHRRFLARAEQNIDVERSAAAFASWYELFPRAPLHVDANGSARHGSFDDVIERLPHIRAMGFDVLYFPPIHPIGATNRKGRNNSLHASDGEPGCPYAIGSAAGGHDAIHPELGDFAAFDRLCRAARQHGIEIALDFAVQCSPDHPWLRQHPDWFRWRPDGSVAYAENPPKKYEDIVNPDFYAEGSTPALWLALRDVVLFWVQRGVRIFRVDNPHTKPVPFWQWLIASVRRQHADVIFLSEAFTRPAMMYRLAKIGFSQSYTYFTWRNTRQELTDYLIELTQAAPRDFFRPNFFVNTPDINPEYLQTSGRAGFIIRAALAATLSGLWGMYSGFELCEAAALPGREEYLDSEKYELKYRNWNAPENISAIIAQLNRIRRDNPALHTHLGVQFFDTGNDRILYFSKTDARSGNCLLIAISLDPHRPQEAMLPFPRTALQLAETDRFDIDELMRGQHFEWRSEPHHWYFNPGELPLAIWRVHVEAELPARAIAHAESLHA